VSGILYALIALGFVLIVKASGVFDFAMKAAEHERRVTIIRHGGEKSTSSIVRFRRSASPAPLSSFSTTTRR
jgi:energy-converting hydrogenase Eha subunit C